MTNKNKFWGSNEFVTFEEYANYGFDFIQEKLEENPNYFFKETAFLRVFLGFLNKRENVTEIDDEPESLD